MDRDPLHGLSRADDVIGAENVLAITHGLWQRRYGGSRDVIGRRVIVSQRQFAIVGVMAPDVECPRGVEAWMTLAASASTLTNPAFRAGVLRDVDLIARLRPGATIEQARSELRGLVSRIEVDAPPDAPRGLAPVVRSSSSRGRCTRACRGKTSTRSRRSCRYNGRDRRESRRNRCRTQAVRPGRRGAPVSLAISPCRRGGPGTARGG